jgi:hypothetical protein
MSLALLLAMTFAAHADPILSVSGECPGVVDLDISGLTPGGSYVLLHGIGAGSDVLPVGPCAGTSTGLSGMRYGFTAVSADGTASFLPTLPGGACSRSIEILDNSTCTLSGAVSVDVTGECSDRAVVGDPVCPAECTGGCDGATCIMDCTGTSNCQVDVINCPDGLNCRVECHGTSSCQFTEITCPATDGRCDIECDGLSACQFLEVWGGAGETNIDCSFTSTCQIGEVTCGSGPCHATCPGAGASMEVHDCGSSCDCSTDCL